MLIFTVVREYCQAAYRLLFSNNIRKLTLWEISFTIVCMPGVVTTSLYEFPTQTYSQSLESKQARYRLYEFMADPVDRTELAIATLSAIGKLPVEAVVADVGSDNNPLLPELDIDEEQSYLATPPHDMHLYEGRIASLASVENNSLDAVFCMDTLHHTPELSRRDGFRDIQRALAPDGAFAFTVSSERNKYVHRNLEALVAESLDHEVEPPHPERGFTTERAARELPQYFDHVYLHTHISPLVIGAEAVEAYLGSFGTLRDQFTPEPDPQQFKKALRETVAPVVRTKLANDGYMVDYVYLSTGLASNMPLDLPDSFGFKSVTSAV